MRIIEFLLDPRTAGWLGFGLMVGLATVATALNEPLWVAWGLFLAAWNGYTAIRPRADR